MKEKAKHIEKRDKNLLAKDRELSRLLQSMSDSCELVPVNPPVRDGWTRTFVLREDIAKYEKHAKYLQESLDACNVTQFSHRKDFKKRDWRHTSGKWKESRLELRKLDEKRFLKLSIPAQNYFIRSLLVPRWGAAYYTYDCIIPKWMLVVKVEKHFIRFRKVYDTNLESQYYRLRKEMNRNSDWDRLDHLYGYSHNYDDWDLSHDIEQEKAYQKIIKAEIEEAREELAS